ncbi:hypothetical protein WA158_006408 [Blastocystis sp. Blastoise]
MIHIFALLLFIWRIKSLGILHQLCFFITYIDFFQSVPLINQNGVYLLTASVPDFGNETFLLDINSKYILINDPDKICEEKKSNKIPKSFSTYIQTYLVIFNNIQDNVMPFYLNVENSSYIFSNDTLGGCFSQINYHSSTRIPSYLMDLVETIDGVFSIFYFMEHQNYTYFDLSLSPPTPSIHLYYDINSPSILSSTIPTEQLYLYNNELHEVLSLFPVYDMLLCGRYVFGSYTNVYPAYLSTTSSCLSVPKQLFNNIINWLPITCDLSNSSYCYLNHNYNSSISLPTISFRLTHDGPSVIIPLDDLLFYYEGRTRLCLLIEVESSNNQYASIIFGTKVLEHFHVIYNDIDRKFYWSDRSLASSNLQCAAVRHCVTGQWYDTISNDCEEPLCGKYFFMTVSADHECTTHPVVACLFWILILSLVTWEFTQFYQIRKQKQSLKLNNHND